MAMLAMTRCMLCDAGMCLVCVGLGKLVPCHLVFVDGIDGDLLSVNIISK